MQVISTFEYDINPHIQLGGQLYCKEPSCVLILNLYIIYLWKKLTNASNVKFNILYNFSGLRAIVVVIIW